MDQRISADQPFVYENDTDKIIMACNGEIYNFAELIQEHQLPVKTGSDCEVILWLYIKYGIQKTLDLMNGEFAIFIIDIKKNDNSLNLYLVRDHCGIRPLFYGQTDTHIAWSSEVKGLTSSLGTE